MMKHSKKSKRKESKVIKDKQSLYQRTLKIFTSNKNAHSIYQGAFTLIEMIIVVIIIAVLAGAGVVALNNALNTASTDRNLLNTAASNNAIMTYYLANSAYPTQAQIIAAFQENKPTAGSNGTTPGVLYFGSGAPLVTLYTQPNCVTASSSSADLIESAC